MQSTDRKQFEFNAFFPNNDFDNWALFEVRVGVGLGYSFNLIGSIRSGEHGMAVFGANDRFVDVVPNEAFDKAAQKLSVDEFFTIYGDQEAFQNWVIQQDDSYWNSCELVSPIIRDFLKDHTDSELHPQPMTHST